MQNELLRLCLLFVCKVTKVGIQDVSITQAKRKRYVTLILLHLPSYVQKFCFIIKFWRGEGNQDFYML